MSDSPVSVFISYSRTDSAFIDHMEADLRAYDFDTWVDRQHLEGGADWARLIETEILKRETLVVALSPDAVTSTWVRREITFALSAGKHIIPVIARPVERVPIEIIEKQYIDLHNDYTRGIQELRVTLLKTRSLPAPQTPAHAPQPLLAMPDVNDPLKGLVQIPAPPPAPNPDLNAIFMQAQTSQAHGNLDLTEALLRQIVEQQNDFGYGLAAEGLEKVRKQLEPKQIERLRKMANDAWEGGAWGQAIGALRALVERLPDDADLVATLAKAEDCQKWSWLYDNARAFAQSRDAAATRVALTQLWEKAPYFGDPSHISPDGLVTPALLPPFARHTGQPTLTMKESGRVVTISKSPFTIGRSRETDLVIGDLASGRVNTAILLNERGAYFARDENSANGTYVNGVRVSQQQLRDGDAIKIGSTVLIFNDHSDDYPKGRNIFRVFTN